MAVQQTPLFRQWTADLVLFLNTAPSLTPEQAEQLAPGTSGWSPGPSNAWRRPADG
ncbi:MAG: hypothetical protein ACLPUO_17715 [Streptosporangiaceae bacterium]|jgi:hypothetical protein